MMSDKSVFCGKCGECLDDLFVPSSGERIPCPQCGSKRRDIHAAISGTIKLSGHVAAVGRREGRAIGFRESDREGRTTSADRNDDGSLSYSILGSSPQGEEDTPLVCQVLVSVLNTLGENWTTPVLGEGIVDCEASENNLPNRKLSIQVVRAIVDEGLWKQLSRQGVFEGLNITKEQLATQMKDAIEKKANDPVISPLVHRNLTLALDATRLPVLGFEDVVEEFKIQFGAWAKSLGFEAIWLVGSQGSLTWRLNGTDLSTE
jgi:hypothetical protein